MRLYVETNFLVEMAFEQSASRACHKILAAASAGEIQLAIPACAFAEAQAALGNKARHKDAFEAAYREHIKGQFSRLVARDEIEAAFTAVRGGLVAAVSRAESNLYDLTDRIASIADVLALSAEALQQVQGTLALDLKYKDALVYASICVDSRYGTEPTAFVTTDASFAVSVAGAMREQQCQVLRAFDDALPFARHVGR